MSNKSNATIATMGIDIGKNSFHVVGLDQRGAIVLRQKWSRGQIEARLSNLPPCLIGMDADSDEVAQAFRDDVARRSEMMSPGCDASVAADFWHSIAERSIVSGRAE